MSSSKTREVNFSAFLLENRSGNIDHRENKEELFGLKRSVVEAFSVGMSFSEIDRRTSQRLQKRDSGVEEAQWIFPK